MAAIDVYTTVQSRLYRPIPTQTLFWKKNVQGNSLSYRHTINQLNAESVQRYIVHLHNTIKLDVTVSSYTVGLQCNLITTDNMQLGYIGLVRLSSLYEPRMKPIKKLQSTESTNHYFR